MLKRFKDIKIPRFTRFIKFTGTSAEGLLNNLFNHVPEMHRNTKPRENQSKVTPNQ